MQVIAQKLNQSSVSVSISTNRARNFRPSVELKSFNEDAGTLSTRPENSKPLNARISVLSRISAAVELQASIQKFETIAGRGAMLGFMSLAIIEAVGDSPIAGGDVGVFVSSLLLSITTATILACTRRRLAGGLLLEAVIASMTCVQRSASSLTSSSSPQNFDLAVDKVLDLVSPATLAASEDELSSVR
ncbi:hypothetical protein CEUSTIGMA_g11994.t1 [Chlamydomonas eustigma]|uniref:Uncharacterized protein n=1 Tax=Chlamydomonas eustigma TaxID=1157962 RepID=A0A250XNK7_9CHLO|nr:hypothetical protein CEUSTIGMA_g11994.t1 [Chlamydomonas eustigma]|eukprot:GAX84573.1 hypothetical protein CEUSTIGMA_g11994.t1 [Chlamydomonas eustigma]